MNEWLGRARRVDALEAEVAALRASLAESRDAVRQMAAQLAEFNQRATLEAERAKAASATAALGDKLLAVREQGIDQSTRLDAGEAALAALTSRVAAMEGTLAHLHRNSREDGMELPDLVRAARAQEREHGLLKSSLLSLERQVRLQAEDASLAASALLERIEQVRRGEQPSATDGAA